MEPFDPSFKYLYRSPGISRYRADSAGKVDSVETFEPPGVFKPDPRSAEELEENAIYVSASAARSACARMAATWRARASAAGSQPTA